MVSENDLRKHMPVVCSVDPDAEIGTVDRVENGQIKLTRDHTGKHHFIPVEWIASVDGDKAHLDRSGKDAMAGWSTETH